MTPSKPYWNTRENNVIRFLGLPTVIRAASANTNGAFGLVEHWNMPPGFATPYHTHHLEDESFYVLDGELAVLCDGKWMKAGPGDFVFGPREIPHGFRVVRETKMLIFASPAGFENFVMELGERDPDFSSPPPAPDMAKLAAVAAKYKIDIHGPLPD
jgi:quercetin dioxygenase-like cupin family protein